MFRHYRVILRELAFNILPSYTSISNVAVGNYYLLFQSAIQPLWVLVYSTVVEYSQQEGFYRVPLPAARQTANLEDR
jgi:hypothetical protein